MSEKVAAQALTYGYLVDIGGRPNIEDRAEARHIQTGQGMALTVAMVADGIGGHQAGEVAAELTIKTIFQELEMAALDDPERIPLELQYAIQKANALVYQTAVADRSKQGMGTTGTLVAIHNHKLYLANVGDSRAYLIREGKAIQISQDHTWGNEMVKRGVLSPQEAAKHPKREQLICSIGYEPQVKVDLGLYIQGDEAEEAAHQHQGLPLQPNDRVVLCSDGLIKERRNGIEPYVTDAEIVQTVTQLRPEKAAKRLVEKAVGRQADDNVSVIVLEMPNSKRAANPAILKRGLIGLLLVAALIALVYLLLPMFQGNTAPATTPESVAETEQVAAAPAATAVPTIAAGEPVSLRAEGDSDGALSWGIGEANTTLGEDKIIEVTAGEDNLWLKNRTGETAVSLPDNSELILINNTTIRIEEMASVASASQTTILIHQKGTVLVKSAAHPIEMKSTTGDLAKLDPNALLHISTQEQPFNFQAACLIGSCVFTAANCSPLPLTAGESILITSATCPDSTAIMSIAYEQYTSISTLVPTPTPTPTPTASLTPLPTETIRPGSAIQATPTAIFTLDPNLLTSEPTQPPSGSGSDSGSGNNPDPTDLPSDGTTEPTAIPAATETQAAPDPATPEPPPSPVIPTLEATEPQSARPTPTSPSQP